MAQSRQTILARIASVKSTKKITKAMQLVASSKLTKQKDAMESNRIYSSALFEMMSLVLQSGEKSIYMQENQDKPAYVFVIASDMGLCGAYNTNVFHMIRDHLSSEDKIVMVGGRGIAWMNSKNRKMEKTLQDLHEDNAYSVLAMQMEEALTLFEKKEISKIQVLYTQYKNTLSFEPVLETILPIQPVNKEEEKKMHAQLIYEPGKEQMLQELIPMVCKSLLFSHFLEAHTSEQASRRMAMESATDNATELETSLEFKYNQARQASITQEITEIVGGANALS